MDQEQEDIIITEDTNTDDIKITSEEDLDKISPDDDSDEVTHAEGDGEATEATDDDVPADTQTTDTTNVEDDLIELSDGTKVTAKELVNGYLRQSDYTKKTQTLAEERRKLEQHLDSLGKMGEKTDDKVTVTNTKSPAGKGKYKPEQLDELKTVLTELGYVSKHEINSMAEKQKREEIINGFFAQHPEYSVENDPGDHKINAFRQELALYNHSDLNVLQKALLKSHEAVSATFSLDKERETQIAQKLKSKSASVGSGGGQKTTAPSGNEQRYTRAQIQVMQEMGVYDGEQPID